MSFAATHAAINRYITSVEHKTEHISVSPVPVQTLIAREAILAGIPPQIALDRAWAESRFLPDAVGSETNGSTSYGVMQLNNRWHPTASTMTVEENIHVGVSYLARQYFACQKNVPCAMRAYRSGRVVRQ